MNLKFWKPKLPASVQIKVIERAQERLRLHEFRADERLTSGMAITLNSQPMTLAADVLRTEHPAYQVMQPDAAEHVRAAHQAKCEGYTLCLANLLSMGTHQKIAPELVPDFAAEELDLPNQKQ